MHVPVRRFTDRVPLFGRLAALAAGTVHSSTAAAYQAMTPDGIAYLDIADAYVQGDLSAAINAVWSPLYSWLLGPLIVAMPRSVHWEFPLVHLVNFAIYVAALAAFEFFWTHVVRFARAMTADEQRAEHTTFPEWAWKFLGYTLFIWVSIDLISLASVTPDLLMSALVYLAAGLVLRVRLGYGSAGSFAMLGLVLGLAYLAKSVMFPLAFAILAVAASPLRRPYLIASRGIVALSVFLVTSGPFIILISQAKGRMTFGESGRLTYVRIMNGVPYPHWQGDPEHGSTLAHPSRRIFFRPPIYEFGTPVPGSYPIGYDPSYWYEGVVPRFESAVQRGALLTNLAFYLRLFLLSQGVLVVTTFVFYAIGPGHSADVMDLLRRWGLAFVAMVALALYSLVLVEGRYVGAFLPLLWGDLLARTYDLPKALDHGGPRQHSSSQG